MESSLLDEYKELGANMRHYGTHYAALLGVFLALTGWLVSVVFGAKQPTSCVVNVALKIAGLLVTVLFWTKTESAHFLWGHFIRRAAEIESELGFRQYSSLPGAPQFKKRPAAWAARIMFICLSLFWFVVLFI
ncbi:MAG TPA: hypothetical protein VMA13_08000 [Candidatus Saccharimonadales bacterium]|nr:hypothetical protein [Candidatus Saccharimonadales bacterium]